MSLFYYSRASRWFVIPFSGILWLGGLFLRWVLLLPVEQGRVFAAFEMLHAGLHGRGRCGGAVRFLVVSSLFPAFLSPSCLSEGGGEGTFTHSFRQQSSTFSLTREELKGLRPQHCFCIPRTGNRRGLAAAWCESTRRCCGRSRKHSFPQS